jgi:hypothetical protein
VSRGVAADQIAAEIAEERVFEGDPIVTIEDSAVGSDERRKRPVRAEEWEDLLVLVERRILGEPPTEFGDFLAAATAVDSERLQRLHP